MRLIKTFHFGLFPQDDLRHLETCSVCLSRVCALLRGIPAGYAQMLGRDIAACARYAVLGSLEGETEMRAVNGRESSGASGPRG